MAPIEESLSFTWRSTWAENNGATTWVSRNIYYAQPCPHHGHLPAPVENEWDSDNNGAVTMIKTGWDVEGGVQYHNQLDELLRFIMKFRIGNLTRDFKIILWSICGRFMMPASMICCSFYRNLLLCRVIDNNYTPIWFFYLDKFEFELSYFKSWIWIRFIWMVYTIEEAVYCCTDYIKDKKAIGLPVSRHKGMTLRKGCTGKNMY
jgi:hypothetical protein